MPKVKCEFKELRRLNRNLQILSEDAEKVMKFSLYEGAKIAADELRVSVDNLGRVSDAAAIQAWMTLTPSIISVSQKNGLRAGLGISKMKVGPHLKIRLKVGFSGYNEVITRRWPQGQPNVMIAASCEHGSSAMLAQPFIRPAYERCAGRIKNEMEKTAKKEISKILDEI